MKLTKLPDVPDKEDALPGMAYFAGTGPWGKTCGDCAHRGMWRRSSIEHYDERLKEFVAKTYRYGGCAMFKALTGKYGPAVADHNRSCKYFEPKLGTSSPSTDPLK